MVKARDSNWVFPFGGLLRKFGYLLGSARAGSNPAGVEFIFFRFSFSFFPLGYDYPGEAKAQDEREGKKEIWRRRKGEKEGGGSLC